MLPVLAFLLGNCNIRLKRQHCKREVGSVNPFFEEINYTHIPLSLKKKKRFHEQGTQANWLFQTKSYSQTAVKHGAAGKYKYTHCDSSYLH